jgi:ferric-dicitrate binding protein FerR (iron transport regulator)
MSKHKALPLSDEILDDATTWFVEFLEGEVGHAAREAFIAWLRTSPEHIRAYLQVTAHWEEAQTLSKASLPSIDELVALAREPTNANVISIGTRPSEGPEQRGATNGLVHKTPEAPRRTHRLRRFFIAASVAISMLGASAVYWLQFQRGVYSTDIGDQRSIRLDDGSTVELNARSKIRVALHEHERDVELLEGQALFRVAKDHARPFIVHSGNANVLAVGTQFDVYKHHGETTVTVVEGRVAVFASTLPTAAQAPDLTAAAASVAPQGKEPESNSHTARMKSESSGQGSAEIAGLPETEVAAGPKGEIFLGAGEQLTVSAMSTDKPEHADVAAATAWIQKQIVFNSTPLSEVADEFNRYNTRQLVITDPKISDTKISGEFSSSNPDSLLKGLDALRKFKIHEMQDRIEISGK